MLYVPLYKYLPDLFDKETRCITIMEDLYGVPKGEYGLVELYCDDLNCDCRRVLIEVLSREKQESIATIAYGWEDEKFYAKWYGITKDDKDYNSLVSELKGPILNGMSKQSKYAPGLLQIIKELTLKDTEYVNRLKKHYKLFKESVAKEKKETDFKTEIGRNESCLCGSGKKYKKCCINIK